MNYPTCVSLKLVDIVNEYKNRVVFYHISGEVLLFLKTGKNGEVQILWFFYSRDILVVVVQWFFLFVVFFYSRDILVVVVVL